MKRVVEYEINADERRSIHSTLIKEGDSFTHAGVTFKIKRGWQRFEKYGREIFIRVLREWSY